MLSKITCFIGTLLLAPASTLCFAGNDQQQNNSSKSQSDDYSLFDIAVYNTCQALEKGQEKQVLDRLLRAGIKPEIHYFNIFCAGDRLLLPSSLQYSNFKSAQYFLRYLRWRERETNNNEIRSIILNVPNIYGETLVDTTQQSISSSQDIAKTLELTSFLSLFKRHGARCLKYCGP